MRRHIKCIKMENHWILVRFANLQDKLLAFDKRPQFVNGLNFVLKLWAMFSIFIERVGQ